MVDQEQQHMRDKMKNKFVTPFLAIICLSATTQIQPQKEYEEVYVVVVDYDNMHTLYFDEE